jgi:hypothetical protein
MSLGEVDQPLWGSDPTQLWAQAQAAVQSHLDQEVLAEAVGLADAELADITLATRLQDSLGHWISALVGGHPCHGQLTGVTTSGEWISVADDILIRVGAVQRFGGLRQLVSPGRSTQLAQSDQSGQSVVSPFHVKYWLRDRLARVIRLHIMDMVIVGVLIDVGADFITIRTSAQFGGQSMNEIVPWHQITHVECVT